MFSVQLTASRLVAALESPLRYKGVVLVVDHVRPVSAGHHGAEPLLQGFHVPRLVKVHLSEGNVADKLLEHRLLLVHRRHLASVVILVALVYSGLALNMDSDPLSCR